jgi:hypothetical protein
MADSKTRELTAVMKLLDTLFNMKVISHKTWYTAHERKWRYQCWLDRYFR